MIKLMKLTFQFNKLSLLVLSYCQDNGIQSTNTTARWTRVPIAGIQTKKKSWEFNLKYTDRNLLIYFLCMAWLSRALLAILALYRSFHDRVTHHFTPHPQLCGMVRHSIMESMFADPMMLDDLDYLYKNDMARKVLFYHQVNTESWSCVDLHDFDSAWIS